MKTAPTPALTPDQSLESELALKGITTTVQSLDEASRAVVFTDSNNYTARTFIRQHCASIGLSATFHNPGRRGPAAMDAGKKRVRIWAVVAPATERALSGMITDELPNIGRVLDRLVGQ